MIGSWFVSDFVVFCAVALLTWGLMSTLGVALGLWAARAFTVVGTVAVTVAAVGAYVKTKDGRQSRSLIATWAESLVKPAVSREVPSVERMFSRWTLSGETAFWVISFSAGGIVAQCLRFEIARARPTLLRTVTSGALYGAKIATLYTLGGIVLATGGGFQRAITIWL